MPNERVTHPLLEPSVGAAIERAASAHRGRRWMCEGFTDLADRAAHPAGVLRGAPFSVFAKLSTNACGRDQFAAELNGLALISRLAQVRTPTSVGAGLVDAGTGWLLLFEAVDERAGSARSRQDFREIGRTLAALHRVHDRDFGLAGFDGFFGPIAQDNAPVASNHWTDFYAERRVRPMLRLAVDSGRLPAELASGVERVLARLPDLAGPDPSPCLLHGDAHQNNFLCTADGVVVIDPAPYFGHPEIDLALVDYFEPVPDDLFAGYREIAPIDCGFAGRRELWRTFGYLAVIAVDDEGLLGRRLLASLAAAVSGYL
jgi:fructosamine-3-kinase